MRKNSNWWQDAFDASFHQLSPEEQKKGKEELESKKYSGHTENLYVLSRRLKKLANEDY